MIIYWSMLFWTPLVYVVYFFIGKNRALSSDPFESNIKAKCIPFIWFIVLFGFFFFWMAIRRRTGDCTTYIPVFNNLTTNFSEGISDVEWSWGSKGPLFQFFNLFFKCYISQDVGWWIFTILAISFVPVLKVFWEQSVDLFETAYLFIAMETFFWFMNGIRQAICIGILFGCYKWILNNNWVKYFLVVFILSFVHMSCLIIIPIYFVLRSKPWKSTTIVFILVILVISLFAEPFFGGVDDALSGTAYAGSTSQFSEDDGVNPLRVVLYAILPVLAFIKRDEIEKYYESNPAIPICINASVISTALYFVGVFTSGILIGRLPGYLDFFALLLYPFVLKVYNNKLLTYSIMILFLLFFYFTFNTVYDSELTGWIN